MNDWGSPRAIDYEKEVSRRIYRYFSKEDFNDAPFQTWFWMKTPNPMLGNVSPNQMLEEGQGEKLLEAVEEWSRECDLRHQVIAITSKPAAPADTTDNS